MRLILISIILLTFGCIHRNEIKPNPVGDFVYSNLQVVSEEGAHRVVFKCREEDEPA